MPSYNFVCQKCQNEFLSLASFEEFDKKDPKKFKCSKCGSKKIKQVIGNLFFIQGNKGIRCSCGG